MRIKPTFLAVAALAAVAFPTMSASAMPPTGLNDCAISISHPYERATCDYVGAGAFTVIDFTQNSGDIDATVSCTRYSQYYDYTTHEEVLTGTVVCHIEIFEYILGSGGSGSIHVYNKVA